MMIEGLLANGLVNGGIAPIRHEGSLTHEEILALDTADWSLKEGVAGYVRESWWWRVG